MAAWTSWPRPGRRSCRCRWPRRARRRWPREPRCSARTSRNGADLALDDLQRLPGLALGERLADADDGHAGRAASAAATFSATNASVSPKSCRRSLWPTMTQRAARLDEHRRADLAGERARVLRVQVLAGDLDPAPVALVRARGERGERRRDDEVDVRHARRRAARTSRRELDARRRRRGASSSCPR